MSFFGFGKKPPAGDPPADKGGGDKGGSGDFEFSPQKAERWFAHARTSHESDNFEYAVNCWLSGLRFEPTNVEALEAFFRSVSPVREASGGKIPKEVAKAITGRTPIDKFLDAILNWAFDPLAAEKAIKAAQIAAELNLREPGKFIAPRALDVAARDGKARKDWFVRLMATFEELEMFNLAVKSGEQALRLDQGDGKLSAHVRNLAAQDTMSKGGYENTGEAGGFRSNVKDLEKQRRLEEEQRVGKGEDAMNRVLDQARLAFEHEPNDKPTIRKYVGALLERGKPEDEQKAIDILEAAFASTKEFNFRRAAGEVRMKQGRRRLRALEAAYKAAPADEAAKAAFHEADQAQVALEIVEYETQVAAYPTDLILKFELGKRLMLAGRHEEAIGQFQEAKADPKNRTAVLNFLGQSFAKIGWNDEAVETYRLALEHHVDHADAIGMELRYFLMCSLQARAEEGKDLASAEEAYKLASAIAIQQINYRDVRTRRDAIKALIATAKTG